jgi:predicted DNA-binding antitoxin AbrB/MazE fold protein
MTITIEAIYENGVLRPTQSLPLKEQEKVRVTVHRTEAQADRMVGVIPCTDPELIEWAALDAELDFPPPEEP